MRLPDKYVEKMKRILGDEYPLYEASLEEPLNHCLRINTLKISVEEFLQISPFELTPVPWTENAFYYDASIDSPSKHPFYFAGLYYLQEASATLPAAVIPIENGDRVLDICAAPGGKTTELAARLKGSGILVSNDISASRLKALQKNVEAFGASNVVITCETPDKLADHFGEYFDKILIDAPCSGEGMFRKSNSMISAWELNGNEKFEVIQRSILDQVVKMLKPGGMILYSTCTFDPGEDEEQILYLLSLDNSLELVPIKMYDGFEPGHAEWVSDGINDIIASSGGKLEKAFSEYNLEYTAHLFPHRVNGEGHYVSLVMKNSGVAGSADNDDIVDNNLVNNVINKNHGGYASAYKIKKSKLPEEVTEFFSHISAGCETIDKDRIEISSDKVFLIPKDAPDTKGLRTMRNGVYLGEIKKKRFEPSQSLPMLLKASDFDNVLRLKPDSIAVYKYLRGETLELEDVRDDIYFDDISMADKSIDLFISELIGKPGWIMICVMDYPLGFAKNIRGTLKNKYLPGWRMTS